MKRSNITFFLSAVASMAVLTSCGGKADEKTETEAPEEKPKVEVQQVSAANVAQISEYTATVEADKTNNITTSTPNRIKQILVDVGATVAKGQKLVVLDDVNIDQIKINLANIEREYNRAVELLNIGGGTRQAVEQLKAQLDAARRQYTNMMENTVLVSPISGVVTARNYDPGDMTGAQPILTIEQLRPVKLMVNVNETEFAKVHTGMPIDITLDTYEGETFNGHVTAIHPTVDPQTRTFTVEVTVNNQDQRVRPGMFARVKINYGEQNHVVVPDRAIVKMPGSGNKYVYVYRDGKVSYNKVELGQRLNDSYEVISGVNSGDQVVITGQSNLSDGVAVDILKK